MKNGPVYQLAITVALTLPTACTRHNTVDSCISRQIPLSSTLLIRQSAADSVSDFLRKNNLPAADIQPWGMIDQELSLSTTTGGSYKGPASQVFYYQYVHGLPVWNRSDPSYIFDSTGVLISYSTGGGYHGPLPNADTTSRQSLAFLRDRFIRAYNDAYGRSGIFANLYADSCLAAVLVYLDASSIPGSGIAQNNQLIKTWLVTPLDDLFGPVSRGPVVFVVDSTGEAIFNDRRAFE